ncbi:tRNAHis guanylyltransferase [Actinidia rufa]|uniref:tRNA(His) guanylyltransferase n=1 Tax=Actinidia rufa TaxID=165716 RepID=A0A7J0GQL6_9ERIC|nr:tRNAHis guanylyltransferase [Actinidia rufa]
MANSKYEYVKSFEVEDEVMVPNLIVVRINGRDFSRFSVIHEFEKPNDEKSLNLMNSCATAVLEEYPDIVFSYGFSDEYSFVFQKDSKLYQRRARFAPIKQPSQVVAIVAIDVGCSGKGNSYPGSTFNSDHTTFAYQIAKILSLIVSFFTSVFVTKWKEYFPQMELRFPPSFQSRVISCASMEVLQAYLAWRQNNCHVRNQYNTCLWMLIRSGKTEREAREILKLEDIVKYKNDGTPVKRVRREVIVDYSGNVASRSFWKGHSYLLYDVGNFEKDINKVKPEYVKSFQFEHKLMPFTWIVVRIDGCHFHRFSEVHGFEKPNDGQALNLMNSCAVAVVQEFQDIVFSYGVSDEYRILSFIRGMPGFSSITLFDSYATVSINTISGKTVQFKMAGQSNVHCHTGSAPGGKFWVHHAYSGQLGLGDAGIKGILARVGDSCQSLDDRGAVRKWRFRDSDEVERGDGGRVFDVVSARVFGVPGEVLFVAIRCGCGWWRRGKGGVAVGGDDELGSREKEWRGVQQDDRGIRKAKNWKDFFPEKELKYPPCFDGRAVCYPSTEILRDYLAWRQVDCHINNQYNTCFWMLVKSGKSKREAQDYLKEVETEMHNDGPREKFQKKVVVEHCDIIGQSFWKAHPSIIDESSIHV